MLKKLPPLLLNNRGGCLNLTASVRRFRCCLSVSVNASINHDDTSEAVGFSSDSTTFVRYSLLPPLDLRGSSQGLHRTSQLPLALPYFSRGPHFLPKPLRNVDQFLSIHSIPLLLCCVCGYNEIFSLWSLLATTMHK